MKLAAGLLILLPLWAGAAPGPGELVQAMESTPDARRGAALYGQCASCHGADGAGVAEGSVPRIAGQHYQVLIKQLVDFRSGRRRDFRMEDPANRHHLTGPQDIADVAAHVSGLESAGARGIGDGTRATAGALLFGARCASCHGADGRGNAARLVPRLAGQHYGYLVRQMYDAVDGRRPTLVQIHARRIEPLDYDQVRGIADYLSRIVPPDLPRVP
jgi:cytochrome c553